MLAPPQRRLDVNRAEPSDVMEYWRRSKIGAVVLEAWLAAIFRTIGVNRTEFGGNFGTRLGN